MDQVAVNLGAPPTQLWRLREKQRELADLELQVADSNADQQARLEAAQEAEFRLNAVLDGAEVSDSVVVHALSEFRAAREAKSAPDALEARLEPAIGRLRQEISTLKQQIRSGQ